MQAPIVQLDLSVKEPVKTANSSHSISQKNEVNSSSFEKELKKAMNAESKQESVSKTDGEEQHKIISQSSDKKLDLENILNGKNIIEKIGFNQKGQLKIQNLAENSTENVTKDLGKFLELNTEDFVAKIAEPKENLSTEVIPDVETPVAFIDEELMQALTEKTEAKETSFKSKDLKGEEDVLASVNMFNQQTGLDNLAQNVEEVASLDMADVKNLKLETGTDLDQKISVHDYRSAAESGVTEASLNDGNFVTSVSYGEGSADITFNLNQVAEKSSVAAAENPKESRFASMLSNQLQNNAADIVKTGSIVLRDGNAGTINLVLHPEQLGNVKISLELHDKLVSAQITVASEEAFQAFKESITALKQAFAESGFQTGGFDLAWAGSGNNGSNQNNNGNSFQQQAFSLVQAAYGDYGIDEISEDLLFEQKNYSDSAQVAVNIMA